MQPAANISTQLSGSIIKKLDEKAAQYRLTRKAIFEELIDKYLEVWASNLDTYIRLEVKESLEKFYEIRRHRGKTRYWVLEQILSQHPDVNQYELGLIGNRLDISANYLVRRLGRLKKEMDL